MRYTAERCNERMRGMTKPRGIPADGALRETGANLSVSDARPHSLSRNKAIVLGAWRQEENYHSRTFDQSNDLLVLGMCDTAEWCHEDKDQMLCREK